MKLSALFTALAFASSSFAATLPTDQARTTDSAAQAQSAQDSANGSMTNTDLTGNVTQDTSALQTGTTSGTMHGAIIDQTARKKKKHKKPKKPATESSEPSTTDAM